MKYMDKEETKKRLEELKGNLKNMLYEDINNKILEITNDFDGDNGYILNLTCRYNEVLAIVDESNIDFLIERCDNDIDRLRCFIGDTMSSTIYKLDGYENLDNVTDGDFEIAIDELLEMLESEEV